MNIIYIIICVIILCSLEVKLFAKYWANGIVANISYKYNQVRCGEQNELIEVVTNNKSLPVGVVNVKFLTSATFHFDEKTNATVTDKYYRNDVFSLMGKQRITRRHTFTCTKRGCYSLRDIDVVGHDYLFQKSFALNQKNQSNLLVCPKCLQLPELSIQLKRLIGEKVSQTGALRDPFMFRGIRDYQSFDTQRQINWKVSARQGSLKVNTFFPSNETRVVLLLNVTPLSNQTPERTIEYMIAMANTISHEMVSQEVNFTFESNGKDCFTQQTLVFPQMNHVRQLDVLEQMLARLDLKQKEEPFEKTMKDATVRYSEECTFLVLTNNVTPAMCTVYRQLLEEGFDIHFIVVETKGVHAPVDVGGRTIRWEVPLHETQM